MVCHAQGISPADDGDKQMSKILPTENQDWGFWGTMREHAATAWPIAFTAIHNATSTDPASVRAFLDSRYRRHFADGVNLVNDEGIRDTLIDLHNYAAMALMLLDE